MIPPLSKRPFGHPLPAEALEHFTHPLPGHVFHRPFRDAAGEHVFAASAVALRLRPSRSIHPAEHPPAQDGALDRVLALPWDRFQQAAGNPKAWRCLDDHRGTIYGDPLQSVFSLHRGGYRLHLTGKAVRLAGAPIVPLAVLQLLARLPKPEIYTAGCTVEGPLLLRFAGGEGIIPHYGIEKAAFEMLKPRDTTHDLEGFKF